MFELLPTKKGIYTRSKGKDFCVTPPMFTFQRYHHLKGRSLIVGFVGARGSGKSVGMAKLAIMEHMLLGKTVWSNMDIGFVLIHNGTKVEYRTKPIDRLQLADLDRVYADGLIVMDEVQEYCDARRAMRKENLAFSYILMQLRKRRLNLMWTAQSEMNCDERIRAQSDIFIMCKDISIKNHQVGIGEYSLWKAHDFSGVIKGDPPRTSDDAVFYQGVEWNRPWWDCFNTYEIQDSETEVKQELVAAKEEAAKTAAEIAEYMRAESPVARKHGLWKMFGVTDQTMMMLVGQVLSAVHDIITNPKNNREYILGD